MDKVERSGLRICDLIDESTFAEKLGRQIDAKNDIIEKIYGADKLDKAAIIKQYTEFGRLVKNMLTILA